MRAGLGLLALGLLALGCSSSAPSSPSSPSPDAPGGTPDGGSGAFDGPVAGSPDAPPSPPTGELERVDFRTQRGEPLTTTQVTVPDEQLFAIGTSGFVTLGNGTLSWRDAAGSVLSSCKGVVQATLTTVSPDGKKGLFVTDAAIDPCIVGDVQFTVVTGTLALLDLETGGADFELAVRTNQWSNPGFTPDGAWFFTSPNPEGACEPLTFGQRRVAGAHEPAPGLTSDLFFVAPADAGRWFTFRGETLGLVDPETAGSFFAVGESPSTFELAGGWLHVYTGFSNLVQDLISIPPGQAIRHTNLRDDDWFAAGAWGRWVRVCSHQKEDATRPCRVVDAAGELAPVDLTVRLARGGGDEGIVLSSGTVIYIGPTDSGDDAVQRIVLATGEHSVVKAGAGGDLRPIGDGRAALLLQDGEAWLVDGDREEKLAEHVVFSLTTPRGLGRPSLRQDESAVLVTSEDNLTFSLVVLDARARRVATVTDHLHFTNPPVSFDDCGLPWVTRKGGTVGDGQLQDASQLYFVEEDGSLSLVPIDLSSPPRRLAALGKDLSSCHPPVVSPDGTRVGFSDGDSVTTFADF